MPFVNFLEKVNYSDKTIINSEIIEYSYERCSLLNSSFKEFLFEKSYLDCCHLENLEIYNSGPFITGNKERIFKKSYSTKGIGRGYGLYLISEIITSAKGHIKCENDKGVRWYVHI